MVKFLRTNNLKMLILIFFVFAILGYYLPDILLQAPKWHYNPPLTSTEVRVLKDNTNQRTEENIDNLYLELGRIEVEILLGKDL